MVSTVISSRKSSIGVDDFLSIHSQYVQAFTTSKIIHFISKSEVNSYEKQNFLRAIKLWSDWFQEIIHCRYLFTKEKSLKALSHEHLLEEIGHNDLLEEEQQNHSLHQFWDPVLDTCGAWFYQKMVQISDLEKLVLMHLVLESAGAVFYPKALKMFPKNKHFSVHCSVDDSHAGMGVKMLYKFPKSDFAALISILNQGWQVLNLMCERMVSIAQL